MHDGIYDKFEMVDNVVACLEGVTVSGAKSVNLLSQAFQMLYCIKDGMKKEDEAKRRTIELLKEQLKRATEPQVEDGGDVVGGQHYDLKFGGGTDGKN